MKYLTVCKRIFLFVVFLSAGNAALSQGTAGKEWTAESAASWLKSEDWQNGLTLKVHPSVNKIAFAQQYHKNKAAWDKALAFLKDSDLTKLKPGKYVIDGNNAYATITEGPEKEFDQTAWESHRKYIDLQYIIKGKEKIGVAPVSAATVVKPYNETTDSANYNADGIYYIAEPGTFFLFFPADAHRPNIKVAGYDVAKKLVIKIKMAN